MIWDVHCSLFIPDPGYGFIFISDPGSETMPVFPGAERICQPSANYSEEEEKNHQTSQLGARPNQSARQLWDPGTVGDALS
jgi:hypothetical protein